jgi:hypothetical protein
MREYDGKDYGYISESDGGGSVAVFMLLRQ